VDEKPDFGSTTAVYEKVGLAWLPRALRNRLTPAAVGSAITAIAIAVWYVADAKHDIHRLQEVAAESARERQKDRDDFQAERDVLHKIDTRLAVMDSKMDGIADKVDRQEQWRDKIEGIADSPPHARKRR
jgi:hypothetical protein